MSRPKGLIDNACLGVTTTGCGRNPRLKPDVNPMPFNGKRMIYGGFEMIVEA